VRLGSYFHQLRPMASALSTEQMSKRIRIVSNSTLASETRMSPAITSPLSRTRSRISSRFAVPETEGTLCIISQEITEEIAGDTQNPRDSCHRILISLATNCQPLLIFLAGYGQNPEGGRSQRVGLRCVYPRNRLSIDHARSYCSGGSPKIGPSFVQEVPQRPQFKVQVFRL
jgi:hypothetical protein